MKIEPQYKTVIKKELARITTKQELVDLLNKLLVIRFGDKVKKRVTLRQIGYYIARLQGKPNTRSMGHLDNPPYLTYEIKKKSGGVRVINAPEGDLKLILSLIDDLIRAVYTPHRNAYGFVDGKSIVDNANLHQGKNYVYNIDLKDFFHSFDLNRVKMGFYGYPFELKGKQREPLAFLLASLATYSLGGKRVLPQGSPCSPSLTNVLCYRLDKRLTGLAKKFGMTYSRYADDITFSSDHFAYNKNFKDELRRIIGEEGLEINEKKVRLQTKSQRQEVTGLTVNERTNVTRKYIKQIRMYLHYIETYGKSRAEEILWKDFANETIEKLVERPPSLENYLRGKLNYLSMVKGKENSTYSKLEHRYDRIFMRKTTFVNQIISVWTDEGIDAAREFYYKKRAENKKDELRIAKHNNSYEVDLQYSILKGQSENAKVSIKNKAHPLHHILKMQLGKDMTLKSFKFQYGWQFDSEEEFKKAYDFFIISQNKGIYDRLLQRSNIKAFLSKSDKKEEPLLRAFLVNELVRFQLPGLEELSEGDLENRFKKFKEEKDHG